MLCQWERGHELFVSVLTGQSTVVKPLGIKTGSNIPVIADNKGNEYIKMSYGEDNFEPAHRLLMDGRNHPVSFKCITFN